nr:uncharacterized mitochondrial protein AtMg00810-like [Tanacetum cinerariifolium]
MKVDLVNSWDGLRLVMESVERVVLESRHWLHDGDLFRGVKIFGGDDSPFVPYLDYHNPECVVPFNVSEDTLNRFKMRGFGILLEACTKADTKHDIGPTGRHVEQTTYHASILVQTDEPNLSACTTIVEVPKELLKVSMEKALVITALKEQLNKLNGKAVITEVVSLNPIDPELLKVDVTPLERIVNREVEEIETLNIELDHKVTKLVAENKHLKQTYKQLYDSIKSSRVRSKEQCDDLINKVNLKSAEVSYLNASLQEKVLEKVLVIAALKEQLNKLKGKAVLTEAVSLNPIDPELLKVDVSPLVLKLRKNRTAHTDYIRHTQEEAATLREIIESERLLSPLNTSLDYALDTPMVEKSKLDEDKDGKAVDPSHYHGMIGTLLYLTASRPDLQFAIRMCARYQARPTKKHVHAVKRIFRYLRGTVNRGLWYSKDSSIAITAFANADHAGCQDTRRSTSGSVQFLGDRLISWSSKRQKSAAISSTEAEYIYLDSSCSKHMTEDRPQLVNFVQKFLGTVKFGNDHVAKIMGYEDYQIGNVTISRVYYVEGLGHNLFSVRQFCDSDLEVAFRQHTCFIRNLDGVDLLTTCAMGKSTKKTHKPKSEDTNQEKLYLLHMDLCGPMRVESIIGKKYILVIVDDYSRFTWVKFLRSNDETLDFIIKFLKMIQVRLKVPVCRIRTDNGTEFFNQTLRDYYEEVGISHETSVARSPQ